MGRTMPTECPHGVTVDWGDFGPCQDCTGHPEGQCPNYQPCERCEAPLRWMSDLRTLRELLALLHAAWRELDPERICKLSDGEVTVRFPGWVEFDDTEQWMARQPSCEVYSYVFGPGRRHDFTTVGDAVDAVRVWGVRYQRRLAGHGIEWAGLPGPDETA